jgi:hypothetical protein
MMMLSAVPATTMSMSLSSSWTVVGFTTKAPSMRPTRTPANGSGNGMSERHIEVDAPTRASTSASFSWSEDTTVAMIWVSKGNALLKSGRTGRSISRDDSTSFSVGRPSRLKNPPGIRPAAYVRSR